MSERNTRKSRRCSMCGMGMFGKATVLKKHGRECKKTHEMAAAQAIMEKMRAEMQIETAGTGLAMVMADERIVNAEGD